MTRLEIAIHLLTARRPSLWDVANKSPKDFEALCILALQLADKLIQIEKDLPKAV